MPRHYPHELRRRTCERMLKDEAIEDLVVELGISEATMQRWKRQTLIDAGMRRGLLSYEADPLAQARKRIKELEEELEITRLASKLYDELGGADPKASSESSEH